ncbi:MAG TPA: SMC-Scp complex subunit ScpB [Candidatus Brocadiia bacterium]|nr:SMC-Scp complex subunit ScpB [Planctomycetota bacterium]MDO8093087.1 SMC-Scp complex subunit ScpB [Candidatus Brocadiales bacterium]
MADTKILQEDSIDVSESSAVVVSEPEVVVTNSAIAALDKTTPILDVKEEQAKPSLPQVTHPVDGSQQRDVKSIVEAILFAANEPVSIRKLCEIIGNADAKQIRETIDLLRHEYDSQNRAFQIEDIADGFQILTRVEYYDWVAKLWKKSGDNKLSQAALETLAIVAYKQPITRANIEAIRGVQSGQMIRTLVEKKLVRIVGREEVLGRPLLYGTTKNFLEQFGLKSIKDLPKTGELDMQ